MNKWKKENNTREMYWNTDKMLTFKNTYVKAKIMHYSCQIH